MTPTQSPARLHPETPSTTPRPSRESARPKSRGVTIILFILLGTLTLAYFGWAQPTLLRNGWSSISSSLSAPVVTRPGPAAPASQEPWDGFVTVTESGRAGMEIATMKAAPQTEPIRLELLGTTEYETDNLTKIRPLFKGRVDKVYTTVGKTVKHGDRLVDLFSTDLAEAKSAYEIKRIQWIYDKNLRDLRERLVESEAVSHQLYVETQNNEMKSRREYEVARDKLLVYGLTEAEVESVKDEAGSQKARMSLRSPADGIVITRDVVVGNLYDDDDTLLVIAPLHHLWVWGNVFESDLDLVHLGQSWEVQFPFLTQKLHGKVEYISNRVDPGTHAVRVRTSIANPEGRLKSEMLVRGMLEIPPAAGHTVIPRTALVVADGKYFVYVKVPGRDDKFERRRVEIAQEKDDHVVIDHGLRAGEDVVCIGSLLLAQLYDDMETVHTGAPPGEGPSANTR